ncbi:MAG: tryptophan synthase subunit alpha [Candidatus Micrarchaeota archaeon]
MKTQLIAFLPLGFPSFEASKVLCKALASGGADILELGVPFSDPIADGPTIQSASQLALENGATPEKCLRTLSELRPLNKELVILTYYNLIYHAGVENFVKRAKEAGVSTILAADLTIEEAREFENACSKHGVKTAFIIAPNTPDARVREIAKHTTGFLYLVAHFGVTGAKSSLEALTLETIARVKKLTSKPIYIGFGISKPEHARALAHAGADGVIVGSAFVKLIQESKTTEEACAKVQKLARGLKEAL